MTLKYQVSKYKSSTLKMVKVKLTTLKTQTLSVLIQFMSWIVPKKKGLIVFRQLHNSKQFTGNIKALMIYMTNNHPEFQPVLISKNQQLLKEAKDLKLKVEYNRITTIKLLLRAQHIVLDVPDPMLASGRFSIIQVWHGTGFKNIGILHNPKNEDQKAYAKRQQKHHQNDKIIVTTSSADAKKKARSFGTKNTVITGLPRNDIFFSQKSSIGKIKTKYSLSSYDKIISYTPTFRDYETAPPFSEDAWQGLNEILKKQNKVFIVKKHPWDTLIKVPNNHSNILDLSDKIEDVQELLLITDLLISDYSSIVTDFAITGKPILFYMYDFELYKKGRSIYYDLEKIFPKPFAFNQVELLAMLTDLSWKNSPMYINSYSEFQKTFHCYKDGNSCKRLVEEIKKLN